VVIPKAIREEAGLEAGVEVDVRIRDGRVEIEPAGVPMHLAESAAGTTIEAAAEMPTLTSAEVRSLLDRVRR
jgi:AbrB family looped-hinge helix DNA binding protein